MSTRLSTQQCRKKLAVVWFSGGGILMLLLIVQSLLGKFGSDVGEVWAWFLPTLMPTLSLMIGVFVMGSRSGGDNARQQAVPFLYRLALCLSYSYIVIVALPILCQPLVGKAIAELIQLSEYWIGPMQGLVAGVLGAFFVNKGDAPGKG